VIFFSSFLLSLIPVLGPIILYIPPFGLALIFSPLPTPLFYLVWLMVGEQFVTNILGPRLQGHNLKIHPLEAMAAALIGLPLAGIPGAFFAVPTMAFLHIVVQEFVRARRSPATASPGIPSKNPPAPGP
jgi:predicted PurR-regulated permease PerM